jgi:transposase InsO family protein
MPLPKGWCDGVKNAVIHTIALAHYAITYARGWAVNSPLQRVRLAGQLEQAQNEIVLLREELHIKDARIMRIPAQERPHYAPAERMAILELKAARNLSTAQTRMFLIREATIASRMKRLNEDGPDALVRLPRIVNKFPDFVRYLVCRLKMLCPTMGKVRIAQVLARAGLHLGKTTIERYIKEKHTEPEEGAVDTVTDDEAQCVVAARYPNHVWHVDLTTVPVAVGFWVPWRPQALQQCWPFCWWLAIVIHHYSRRVMGFAVFRKQPTSVDIRAFLGRLMARSRTRPKYIICDEGTQFWNPGFKQWCKRKNITPRFGAAGQHGSIAMIERFIRSMKYEYVWHILVPMHITRMRQEIVCYVDWYNQHRPHQGLSGATPLEIYQNATHRQSQAALRTT